MSCLVLTHIPQEYMAPAPSAVGRRTGGPRTDPLLSPDLSDKGVKRSPTLERASLSAHLCADAASGA